jgi:hypothetical protein
MSVLDKYRIAPSEESTTLFPSKKEGKPEIPSSLAKYQTLPREIIPAGIPYWATRLIAGPAERALIGLAQLPYVVSKGVSWLGEQAGIPGAKEEKEKLTRKISAMEPEKIGFVTPKEEETRAYRDIYNYQKSKWRGHLNRVVETATDLGGVILQVMAARKIPPIGRAATLAEPPVTYGEGFVMSGGLGVEPASVRAISSLMSKTTPTLDIIRKARQIAHTAKGAGIFALHGALTTPGDLRTRTESAMWRMMYGLSNIHPVFTNITTPGKTFLVDMGINSLLSSPAYASALKQATSKDGKVDADEFLGNALPQLAIDVVMAAWIARDIGNENAYKNQYAVQLKKSGVVDTEIKARLDNLTKLYGGILRMTQEEVPGRIREEQPPQDLYEEIYKAGRLIKGSKREVPYFAQPDADATLRTAREVWEKGGYKLKGNIDFDELPDPVKQQIVTTLKADNPEAFKNFFTHLTKESNQVYWRGGGTAEEGVKVFYRGENLEMDNFIKRLVADKVHPNDLEIRYTTIPGGQKNVVQKVRNAIWQEIRASRLAETFKDFKKVEELPKVEGVRVEQPKVKVTEFEYKPGIKYFATDVEGIYHLEQNPKVLSIFGKAKKSGIDILWEVKGKPVPGNVNYTGRIRINGEWYSREQGKKIVGDLLSKKEKVFEKPVTSKDIPDRSESLEKIQISQLNTFRDKLNRLGKGKFTIVLSDKPLVFEKIEGDKIYVGSGIDRKGNQIYLHMPVLLQTWKLYQQRLLGNIPPGIESAAQFIRFVIEHEKVHLLTGIDGSRIDESIANIIALERIGRKDLASTLEGMVPASLKIKDDMSRQALSIFEEVPVAKTGIEKIDAWITQYEKENIPVTREIPAETAKVYIDVTDQLGKDIYGEEQSVEKIEGAKIISGKKKYLDKVSFEVRQVFKEKGKKPAQKVTSFIIPLDEQSFESFTATGESNIPIIPKTADVLENINQNIKDAENIKRSKIIKKAKIPEAEIDKWYSKVNEELLNDRKNEVLADETLKPEDKEKILTDLDAQVKLIKKKAANSEDEVLNIEDAFWPWFNNKFTGEKIEERDAPDEGTQRFDLLWRMTLRASRLLGVNEERMKRFFGPAFMEKHMRVPEVAGLEEIAPTVIQKTIAQQNPRVPRFLGEVFTDILTRSIRAEVIKQHPDWKLSEKVQRIQAISQVMLRAAEEIGHKDGSPIDTFFRTEIGQGWAKHANGFQAQAFKEDMKAMHEAMKIGYSDTDVKTWEQGRQPLAFFNLLKDYPQVQALVVWTKARVEKEALKAGLDNHLFDNTAILQSIMEGFAHRVFKKMPWQQHGGGFGLPSIVELGQKYKTFSEFKKASGGRDLKVIDNILGSVGDYIADIYDKIRLQEYLNYMTAQKVPGTDLGLVEYTTKTKDEGYLTANGYTKMEFAPGLARWRTVGGTTMYEVPWVHSSIYNLVKDIISAKVNKMGTLYSLANKVNKTILRFVLMSPYQWGVPTPGMLWMNPTKQWKYLWNPLIPTKDWLIKRGLEEGGKELKGEGRPLTHFFDFPDIDPQRMMEYMNWGSRAFDYDGLLASVFDKEAMAKHPALRSEYERYREWLWGRGGIDKYTFNNYSSRIIYHLTKSLQEKFMRNNKMSYEDAGRRAVMMVNDITGLIDSRIYGKEGPLLNLLLMTRDYTMGILRTFTGAMGWHKDWDGEGLKSYFNAILHGEKTKADMKALQPYYAQHLMKMIVAKLIMVNLLQYGWSFLNDDSEERGKFSFQNEPNMRLNIKTPFRDADGQPLYLDTLILHESNLMVDALGDLPIFRQLGGRGIEPFVRQRLSYVVQQFIDWYSNTDWKGQMITEDADIIGHYQHYKDKIEHALKSGLPFFIRPDMKLAGGRAAYTAMQLLAGSALKRGIPTEPGYTWQEAQEAQNAIRYQNYLERKARQQGSLASSDQELASLVERGVLTPTQALNIMRRRPVSTTIQKQRKQMLEGYQSLEELPSWLRY